MKDTFAEFKLTEQEGHKCEACVSEEFVLHIDVRIGQFTTEGHRCDACRSALSRCLVRAWEGNSPATELLKACKTVVTLFAPGSKLPPDIQESFRRMVEHDPVLIQVRAAIAKAEGGQA